FLVNINITAVMTVYVAIGILAAFDSILGAIVATLNKRFNMLIFISGFFTNALLSVIIILLLVSRMQTAHLLSTRCLRMRSRSTSRARARSVPLL
ncbi:MAG: DUF1290 domain-containing protein, partial [Clostridia bacterium]|nr:DUF1290 domain-containing protein [Clostridia bacterium]